MTQLGVRALTYVFYRWKLGPWSLEADWGLDWLKRNGLVDTDDQGIKVTATGRKLVKDAKEVLERNKEIVNIIDKVSEIHAIDTGKVMKALAYGIPAPSSGKLIEDVEKGEVVLQPLDSSTASKLFLADDSWIETLELLLDKKSRESIEEAMEDARQGRIQPYRPVG